MKPVIVTKELISEGLAVMRGRDWNYLPDQDGGAGNRGIVKSLGNPEGWCSVEWENGKSYVYRIGYTNKYDLYVYIPGYYDSKPELVKLSYLNCCNGLKVQLRKDASAYAKIHLREGTEYIIEKFTSTFVKIKGIGIEVNFANFDICSGQSFFEREQKPVSLPKVGKFSEGEIVYFRGVHDVWSKECKIVENTPYAVGAVSGKFIRLDSMQLWLSEDQFMSKSEWDWKPYVQSAVSSKPDLINMGDLQKGIVAISENSKPNKNGNNGNNTDTSDYSGRTLELPSAIISLERGERIEGTRLYS